VGWQDIVFASGQGVFVLALVPALRSRTKPPRSTCLITGSVLALFTFAFASLSFAWSAATSALCAFFWFILFIQQQRRR